MALQGKKIIVGVSGSIAAYKTVSLVRLLSKAGCDIRVVMTQAASSFVSPLTFSTLAKNEVVIDLFSDSGWNNHVELGLWADLMIIAPASANTMAKAASGNCDNMLLATYLSAKCPVVWCPAMDLDMYIHPSTVRNMNLLTSYGNKIIAATSGELASGLVGQGRMEEPEAILAYVENMLTDRQNLLGVSVMITAGPTFEALDPVRFIGNHSSGKMGIALAEQAAGRGAKVELILGPTHLRPHHSFDINVHLVSSAQEMFNTVSALHKNADVSIFAAAVADYKPKYVATQKIKKSDTNFTLELEKNVDIAYEMGKSKSGKQIHIGFALETENSEENAKAKLAKKNFDFIVLNTPTKDGSGFKHDTNQITIIDSNNITAFELKSKVEVANDILDYLLYHTKLSL